MGKYRFFVTKIITRPTIIPEIELINRINIKGLYPKKLPTIANSFISPPPIPSLCIKNLYKIFGMNMIKKPDMQPMSTSIKKGSINIPKITPVNAPPTVIISGIMPL